MPLDHVTLIESNLAAALLESLAYGIFLVLGFSSMYLVSVRHRRANSTGSVLMTPMFTGGLLLMFTVSAHWILSATRLFKAFVFFQKGAAPIRFYADLTDPTEVVKTGFLMASLVIGDALIIYRLWVVWAYNRVVIIFPILCLIGLIISGVGITYQFSQFKLGQNVFVSDAGRWITSDAVFTLVTNLYSTIFIAYRMWSVNRQSGKYASANTVMTALAIFVESAAVYTTWAIFFLVAYESESLLQFVAVDVLPHMAGIAFMLINVRVGLGWAQTAGLTQNSFTTSSTYNRSHIDTNQRLPQNYPRPVAVNISHVVDISTTQGHDDFELHDKGMV